MEKLEPLYFAGGNLNGAATFAPNSSTPNYIPKRVDSIFPHKTSTQMFTTVLFIIAKNKQPKYLSGLKNCDTYIQRSTILQYKGMI